MDYLQRKTHLLLMVLAGYFLLTFFLQKLPGFTNTALDIQIHDSYYVISYHLLYLVTGLFISTESLFYWYNKKRGFVINKFLTVLHLIGMIIPFLYFAFLLPSFLGMSGVPRRYYTNADGSPIISPPETNYKITLFFFLGLFIIGQIAFILNLFLPKFKGKKNS